MIVFEARYNPCIHESAFATLSIHETRKGAVNAMKAHKAKEKKEWKEIYSTKKDRKDSPFGQHEDWDVIETKVLE